MASRARVISNDVVTPHQRVTSTRAREQPAHSPRTRSQTAVFSPFMSLANARVASATSLRASSFTPRQGRSNIRAQRTPPPPRARRTAVVTHANLFSRFTRVIGSYANSLITAAEDPEKLLESTVMDMQNDLIKMRQATAQVIASQKQLEKKYEAAQQASDDWYKRAQLAMEKGDEDLAREALTRRKSYAENAESMKTNLDAQKDAVEKLIANTRLLESKMAEAKSKKDTLKARAASAKTNKAVNDMVSGMSTSSALSAFERMEEKVMSMEAEAEAMGVFAAPDDLEKQFKALEAGGGIDDELQALKKSLPGASSKGALPEGRPVSDAIESELDALRKSRDDN